MHEPEPCDLVWASGAQSQNRFAPDAAGFIQTKGDIEIIRYPRSTCRADREAEFANQRALF